MKKIFLSLMAAVAVLTTSVTTAKAADLELGADLVSSYVWRGAYTTGASFQPNITLGLGDFSIGAWGSTPIGFSLEGAKEVDFSVGYAIGDFSIGLTDYWWSGQGLSYFEDHYFEATLAYYFGDKFPLTLAVSTMFAGADKDEVTGDQLYSTYIDLSYGFAIKDVDCAFGVGVSPMKGAYTGAYDDEFSVCSISLSAAKSIPVTPTFDLPVFVQAIVSPSTNDAFLVFGLSF